MAAVTLITVYHFNSQNVEAYTRLVRGLRSTTRQLQSNNRLILVANGISDGAEDPNRVLRDVNPSHPERVVPVAMLKNAGIAGGINAGIEEALKDPCDWIGQIQSSVVIGSGWLQAMISHPNLSSAHGLSGRLVYEDQPDTIWSDGHYLEKGRTLDIQHDKPQNKPNSGSTR